MLSPARAARPERRRKLRFALRRPRHLFGVLALALAIIATSPEATAQLVIPQGKEAAIQSLFEPYRLGDEIAGGYAWMGLQIGTSGFTALLSSKSAPEREVRLLVELRSRDGAHEAVFTTSPGNSEVDAAGLEAANRLRESVQARATPDALRSLVIDAGQAAPRKQSSHPTAGNTFPVVVIIAALVLLLASGISRTGSRLIWRVAGAVAGLAIGITPLVAYRRLVPSPSPEELAQDPHLGPALEQTFVVGVFAAALMALALVGLRHLIRTLAARSWRDSGWTGLLVDVGLVTGWSLFVRFGLATANVLTDGGSGWGRLIWYRSGFSGVAVLVDLVRPDATMLESIAVPRFAAALAAPLLVLIARELELDRATRLLAGLALASWPLHAALYSSDFEGGTILTLTLLALWLVMTGRRLARGEFVSGALLLAAYTIWGRPETLALGLPLLLLALPPSPALLTNPAVLGGASWLLSSAWVRHEWLSINAITSASSIHLPYLAGMPLADFLSSWAIAPAWVWLTLPLGVVFLRGRSLLFVLALATFAAVPFAVTRLGANDGLEYVRYGTPFLPLLALVSARGWTGGVAWLSGRLFSDPMRTRVNRGAAGAVIVVVIATPLLHREYLTRRYGPTAEVDAFTEAMSQVPSHCALVVPDDGRSPAGGSLEVEMRYLALAEESRRARRPTPEVMGFSRFLDQVDSGQIDPDRGCWMYFEGISCFDPGTAGASPAECGEIDARFEKATVTTFPVEYRSHRLLTRPHGRDAPLYRAQLPLTLWHLSGKGRDAPGREEAQR